MDRRQFISVVTGAATLFGVAPAGHAERGEQSSSEFVRKLYEKQAQLHAANIPMNHDEFYDLFARDLRKLMKAPRRYPNSQPTGPILNAFFGWGVLPRLEVKVDKIALVSGGDDGSATVGVDISYRGERHRILAQVVRETKVWRIANISYDSGDNLADYYRKLIGN